MLTLKILPGNVVYRFISLAVSMTLPPPTAKNASGFQGFANAIASLMLLSLGSTLTWSYTSKCTPSLVSPSITCFMASSLRTFWSVTTMTRFEPMFLKSMPTSFVHPGPKRMLDAAISKAYSFCCE